MLFAVTIHNNIIITESFRKRDTNKMLKKFSAKLDFNVFSDIFTLDTAVDKHYIPVFAGGSQNI